MILATTPAPTVRPPSRMAKRRPSSMAMGHQFDGDGHVVTRHYHFLIFGQLDRASHVRGTEVELGR